MKFLDRQAALGAAILLLSIPSRASHSHLEGLNRHSHHHHKKAHTSPKVEGFGEAIQEVKKRDQCQFPSNAGLVPVNPGGKNAGWAMAPDMPCVPGKWCPYACPAGQLMGQWDPSVTQYGGDGDGRTHGGLFCDNGGNMVKPFPSKPYCYDGLGTVKVQNNLGQLHVVCQTVLPGYEDMLVPTEVHGSATLAVPGLDYWASTAAHYYHQPPGVTAAEGCVWGSKTNPVPLGNWAPYVSGANVDGAGLTYLKIAWNPIYLEPDAYNLGVKPTWGLKIDCPDGGCNGLPCSIDPAVNNINEVTSSLAATGAGGGNFCVVTIPKGGTGVITVFNAGGSSSSGAKQDNKAAAASSTKLSPTPTSTTTTQTTSSSTSSSTKLTTSSSTSMSTSSSTTSTTSRTTSSTTTTSDLTTSISNAPHVLFENNTMSANSSSDTMVSTTSTFIGSGSATAVLTSASAAATSKSAASSSMVFSETMGLGAFLTFALTCLI